ncbi:serine/threonine protein kinase, FIKK family [Plasmodium sp. gorilla clade G2]|uniref:serine/threonine protein kinase, FIKK family n=1 Tax=Plasmodium sp. gorilla clade G2 TaxID=880535 RepID=UPI000D20EB4B|nr:serine/threonine protein kinase, FIKK family [Plasmodium sp. gorilla clade G2]SOV13902.1 serine/threonine protein kinase, FIKK family [Plasmodium sp. gorilla clade G2]
MKFIEALFLFLLNLFIFENHGILFDEIFERYNRSLSEFISDHNKDEKEGTELLTSKIEEEQQQVYVLKDVTNDYMNDSIYDNVTSSVNDYLKVNTTDSTNIDINNIIKDTIEDDKTDTTNNVLYDSTNTTTIENSNGKNNKDECDHSLGSKKIKKKKKKKIKIKDNNNNSNLCDEKNNDVKIEKGVSTLRSEDTLKSLNEDDNVSNSSYDNNDKKTHIINELEEEIKGKCVFNWDIGQESLLKMFDMSYNFEINNVNYEDWVLHNIPTKNFSERSGRVQEMFKVVINSNDGSDTAIRLFVKKIPIKVWIKQYNLMKKYKGEYVFGSENFIMEAMALSFLTEYHPGIAPKLYKVLIEPENMYYYKRMTKENMFANMNTLNEILSKGIKDDIKGNIVIVSELFGKDIKKFLFTESENILSGIENNTKKMYLNESLKLLVRLHEAGLAHLDFTAENILIKKNGDMRLCDFGKSTLVYTYNLRHIKNEKGLCYFESCIPSIGKIAYIPPECWEIKKLHKTEKIRNPYTCLRNLTDQEQRKRFYFDVLSADKFMVATFFIWMWNEGHIWDKASASQDEIFFKIVENDMSLKALKPTKKWPRALKSIIKDLISLESRKNINLKDLIDHPWFSKK